MQVDVRQLILLFVVVDRSSNMVVQHQYEETAHVTSAFVATLTYPTDPIIKTRLTLYM